MSGFAYYKKCIQKKYIEEIYNEQFHFKYLSVAIIVILLLLANLRLSHKGHSPIIKASGKHNYWVGCLKGFLQI